MAATQSQKLNINWKVEFLKTCSIIILELNGDGMNKWKFSSKGSPPAKGANLIFLVVTNLWCFVVVVVWEKCTKLSTNEMHPLLSENLTIIFIHTASLPCYHFILSNVLVNNIKLLFMWVVATIMDKSWWDTWKLPMFFLCVNSPPSPHETKVASPPPFFNVGNK